MLNDVTTKMNIDKSIGSAKIAGELNIKKGSTVVLIGPNGVGKTVTLSLLAGLMKQKKGNVQIQESIGCALQGAKCYPFSVEKNLMYFGRLKGMQGHEIKNQMERMLTFFGVKHLGMQQYKILSRGNQKIVEIMQAFLGDPEWVLLDEPFAGLDPLIARKLEQFIIEKKKSQTILLTSHQLQRLHLCDTYYFLHQGEIKEVKGKQALTIQLKKKNPSFVKKLATLTTVKETGTMLYCEGNAKKIIPKLADIEKDLASLSMGNIEQTYEELYGNYRDLK